MKLKIKNFLVHLKDNSYVINLSIIFGGLLISCSILIITGGLQNIIDSAFNVFPKFALYTNIKDIQDYEFNDAITVLNKQPSLSYSNLNAKYAFVEVSDLNCPNCAYFHGYNVSGKSSFDKVKEDFIVKGKMDYIFVDKQFLSTPDKHLAMYCAGDQDPKAFFDYKDLLYKNFNQDFNENKAVEYAKSINLNQEKFSNCYSSQKYLQRISNLSKFSTNVLNVKGTPTFLLYKIEKKEIKGTNELIRVFTYISKIEGNVSYELTLYPFLNQNIK